MKQYKYLEKLIALLTIFVPTILIIFGVIVFPYPIQEETVDFLLFPLFLSLILLGSGFVLNKERSHKLKIAGWMIFAFYWSTQTSTLYFYEDGDIFNASLCIVGVYVLFYLAYHEWLSLKRKEWTECLDWVAGTACIAGFIYFGIERTYIGQWLIEVVAAQSGWLLNLFTKNIIVFGPNIFYSDKFVVRIIFACTAVQSMVLFIGMILSLKKVDAKRKLCGILVTLFPIYFLNLIRNAGITYLVAMNITSLNLAHNIIGKGGSVIALILLLLIVIKIVPELFNQILCLTDLPKRKGPIELFIEKYVWRKKI